MGEEPIEQLGSVPQIAEMQKVDPEAWREEVERITPQLKVQFYDVKTELKISIDNTTRRSKELAPAY